MKPLNWITVALFAAVSMLLVADSVPAVFPEQGVHEWASDQRADCLEDCRQWFEGYAQRGGRGKAYRHRARMYARCVAKCERTFWKEWNKEIDKLK